MTERQYIAYRKIKAAVRSAAFYLCRIFPIDRNLICVCTFEGKGGFGCNPKYIVQELHKERPDLKFVCISGTKGYIIAQSPWWLMKHFEVRYEDENKVESYDPTFRGDGLRYEIEGF